MSFLLPLNYNYLTPSVFDKTVKLAFAKGHNKF